MYNLYSEHGFNTEWLSYAHRIPNECGMSDVWLQQGANITTDNIKTKVSQILKDQFQHHWKHEMETSDSV